MTDRHSNDNTRQFRRRPMRFLVDYNSNDGVRCDYATTIGAGGMFIETEASLPVGSTPKMRFRLPDHETLHDIEGRVCWASDDAATQADQAPGLGVQFSDCENAALLSRELEDLD